jgi:hypothetical protein
MKQWSEKNGGRELIGMLQKAAGIAVSDADALVSSVVTLAGQGVSAAYNTGEAKDFLFKFMKEFREEVKRERTRLPVLEDHLIRVYPHHKAKIQRLMKKLQEQGVIRGNKPYWKVSAEGTEEGVIVLDNESEFAFGIRVCEAFNEDVSVKSEDWIDIDTDVIATALLRGLTTSGFMKRPKEVSLKGWRETILAFYIGDLKRGIGSSVADLTSFGLNKVGAAAVEALANEILEESRIPALSKLREEGTISESDMNTLLNLETKVSLREKMQLKGTPKEKEAEAAYEKAYGAELANSVKLTLKEYTQTAQKQGVQLESALKSYVNDEKNALAKTLGDKGLSLCLEDGRYVAKNGDNEKVAHMYIDKLNCLKEVVRRNDVWLDNHKKVTHAMELKLQNDLRVRAERERQQNKFIQSAKYGWDVAHSTLGYMTPKQKRLVAANTTIAALGTVSSEQQTTLAALSSLHYLFETQEGQKCLGEYLDSKTVKNLRHETTKKMETWARDNPNLAPLIQDDILFRNWVTHASVGELQGTLIGTAVAINPISALRGYALFEATEAVCKKIGMSNQASFWTSFAVSTFGEAGIAFRGSIQEAIKSVAAAKNIPVSEVARNAALYPLLKRELVPYDVATKLEFMAKNSVGKVMAGAGHKTEIRDAQRLAAQYGGKPEDWAKMKSGACVTNIRPDLKNPLEINPRVHWYENVRTGQRVEAKVKIPEKGLDKQPDPVALEFFKNNPHADPFKNGGL